VHELSISEDILDLVEKAVGPDTEVTSVHLTLGPLSGISADALRFCFGEVTQLRTLGSPELVIDETTARVHCCDCDLDYESRDFLDGCPRCHSLNRRILSGREFTVDWVELSEDEDA